jgi:hypothetical protein
LGTHSPSLSRRHPGPDAGNVEKDGEAAGARRVEEVGGQVELGRDVERVTAEHVDDERVYGARLRAEEVAERRVHGAEEVE